MHLDATCDLVLVSRMLRSLHYLSCGWVAVWVAGWVDVDNEINAKPAQAEAGVGAELGNYFMGHLAYYTIICSRLFKYCTMIKSRLLNIRSSFYNVKINHHIF